MCVVFMYIYTCTRAHVHMVPPLLAIELTNIGLGDNRIGNTGAKALANLIRSSSTLQTVILSGNSIRDEGASQLMAALSQNSSLKKLFLANVSKTWGEEHV